MKAVVANNPTVSQYATGAVKVSVPVLYQALFKLKGQPKHVVKSCIYP